MNLPEIRNEFSRVIQHMPLCQTRHKENPGPCTCYHDKAVEELTYTIAQVLKGNK